MSDGRCWLCEDLGGVVLTDNGYGRRAWMGRCLPSRNTTARKCPACELRRWQDLTARNRFGWYPIRNLVRLTLEHSPADITHEDVTGPPWHVHLTVGPTDLLVAYVGPGEPLRVVIDRSVSEEMRRTNPQGHYYTLYADDRDNYPRLEREINAAAIRVVQAWATTLADIASLETDTKGPHDGTGTSRPNPA